MLNSRNSSLNTGPCINICAGEGIEIGEGNSVDTTPVVHLQGRFLVSYVLRYQDR